MPPSSFRDRLTYDQYLDLLGSCDVALMPLEGIGGEQYKSDLKFLEASSRGVVSIASPSVYARDPSKMGRPGIIASSPSEWSDAARCPGYLQIRNFAFAWERRRKSTLYRKGFSRIRSNDGWIGTDDSGTIAIS